MNAPHTIHWPTHTSAIATAILGTPNKSLSSKETWRYRSKGSLAVHVSGPHQGTWRDHEAQTGGGVLDLIVHVNGGTRHSAAQWAIKTLWLKEECEKPANLIRLVEQRQHPYAQPLRKLDHKWLYRWENDCRPITANDPAGQYLLSRACALPREDGDLRWNPSWRHPCGHVGPALVGLVTKAIDASTPITLHSTWIRGDGSDAKAFDHIAADDRPRAKRYLKGFTKTGGVCRLWPDDVVTDTICLAEGIETALSAAAWGHTPIWAALDAENLGSFELLPGIDEVVVIVDNDTAGNAAWQKLAQRYVTDGRGVTLVSKGQWGTDFNDWARAQQKHPSVAA